MARFAPTNSAVFDTNMVLIDTILGPNDPSVTVDESRFDELLYEPLDEVNARHGMGKASLYIVLACTIIVLCIFAYQLIKLVIRIKDRPN